MQIRFVSAIRTDKINGQRLAPIVINAFEGENRIAQSSTGKRIHPDHWDAEAREVKSSAPNHSLLNIVIQKEINRLNEFVLKRQALNLPVTVEMIKKLMKGSSMENFYTYAEWVLENKRLKDEQGYSEETKRRYRDEIKRMQQYREKITFGEITVDFLKDYKKWLIDIYRKKDDSKLDENSIWKAFSFIRMIYLYAISKKIVLAESNPFGQFEVGTYTEHDEKKIWLDSSHLDKIEKALIEKKEIMDATTYKVGWRFLAMCVSGMRISDAALLDNEFMNDAGDIAFTPYKTRRFGNKAQIPVTTDRQKRYLQITLTHRFAAMDPKSFRKMFNDHLKLLAAHAEIPFHLTSHVGRHTMGSFLVDADVKDKSFKAIFGIKSDKTIRTYEHLKESKLRSEADKLKDVM